MDRKKPILTKIDTNNKNPGLQDDDPVFDRNVVPQPHIYVHSLETLDEKKKEKKKNSPNARLNSIETKVTRIKESDNFDLLKMYNGFKSYENLDGPDSLRMEDIYDDLSLRKLTPEITPLVEETNSPEDFESDDDDNEMEDKFNVDLKSLKAMVYSKNEILETQVFDYTSPGVISPNVIIPLTYDPIQGNFQRTKSIQKKKLQSNNTTSIQFTWGNRGDVSLYNNVIKHKLYQHQQVGVNFLWSRICIDMRGCILADFMGLGKSLQVISFINVMKLSQHICPVLIVCPKSVIKHWVCEFETFNNWIVFDKSVQNLEGSRKKIITMTKPTLLPNNTSNAERQDIIKQWYENKGVLIVSYFKLLKIMKIRNNERMLCQKDVLLILDEGHKVKRESTKTYRNLQNMNTKKKIILTGYPLQNNLLEYFTMINFILPSYLSDKLSFKRRFVKPIELGNSSESSVEDIDTSNNLGRILNEKLSKYILRRGIDVLQEQLPIDKEEVIVYIKMTKLQKHFYNKFVSFLTNVLGAQQGKLFWAYNILTLICNHPKLLKNYFYDKGIAEIDGKDIKGIESNAGLNELILKKLEQHLFSDVDMCDAIFSINSSNKMKMLFHILFSCKKINDKLVVFTKSILTLNFLKHLLNNYNVQCTNAEKISFLRMDGQTTVEKRQELIDKFNDINSYIDVFIISTLACCEGINLSSANRVILFDVNWNPSNDVEATSRVFRFGQKKNVTIYRLVTVGTIENTVHTRQLRKQKILGLVCDNERFRSSCISEGELLSELNLSPILEGFDVIIDNGIADEITTKSIIPNHKEIIASVRLHKILMTETSSTDENAMVDEGDEKKLKEVLDLDVSMGMTREKMNEMVENFEKEGFFEVRDNQSMEIDSDSDYDDYVVKRKSKKKKKKKKKEKKRKRRRDRIVESESESDEDEFMNDILEDLVQRIEPIKEDIVVEKIVKKDENETVGHSLLERERMMQRKRMKKLGQKKGKVNTFEKGMSSTPSNPNIIPCNGGLVKLPMINVIELQMEQEEKEREEEESIAELPWEERFKKRVILERTRMKNAVVRDLFLRGNQRENLYVDITNDYSDIRNENMKRKRIPQVNEPSKKVKRAKRKKYRGWKRGKK